MRKARNVFIGISIIAGFFMALAGCGTDNDVVKEPVEKIDNNQIVQQVEIQKEPTTTTGFTGELFVKRNAQVAYPSVIMQFSGASNATMSPNPANNASLVNLDESIFTVLSNKNDASSNVSLYSSDHTIRLYSNASGEGASLEVIAKTGYEISSVLIDFKQNASCVSVYSGNSNVVEPSDGVYSINNTKFIIKNSVERASQTVSINSVTINYLGPSAKDIIENNLETYESLSYSYTRVDNEYSDTINRDFIDVSSYSAWSDKSGESLATYAGFSSSSSAKIYLKSTDHSCIITTGNSLNNVAKRVTIKWHTTTDEARIIQVYGKNTPYESISDMYGTNSQKGTLISEEAYNARNENDESIVDIDSDFKYIGIRSKSDTLYVISITIDWNQPPVYSYPDAAIRFGGFVNQALWNRLNSESAISGYGVLLSTKAYIGASSIAAKFDEAMESAASTDDAFTSICAGGNIKNFPSINEHPALATDEQKGGLEDNYYIWNLYKGISTEKLAIPYTAVAYIKTNNGVVFLKEASVSAAELAQKLINDNDDLNDESYDGSLGYLADLA